MVLIVVTLAVVGIALLIWIAKRKMGVDLVLAAQTGDEATVQTLLNRRANVNARDAKGVTVLMGAIGGANPRVIEKVLERGADVNAHGGSDNGTPLMAAAVLGQIDTVRSLVERGADVNARDNDGTTPLIFVVACSDPGAVRVVEFLLTKGADVSAKNSEGETALMTAAFTGRTDIAKLLLASGSDASAKAKNGTTAISIALSKGHREITALFQTKTSPTSPTPQVKDGVKVTVSSPQAATKPATTSPGIATMLRVCSNHRSRYKPIEMDALFNQGVSELKLEGAAGAQALAALIDELLAARCNEIKDLLEVASRLSPNPELVSALRRVIAAPGITPGEAVGKRFPPVITGGDKIGWDGSAEEVIKRLASKALRSLGG